MVHLVAEAIAAVDAGDPVEVRRLAELQGDEDLDGDVLGPAFELPQVLAVEDTPFKNASWATSLATSGDTGPTTGMWQCSPSRTSLQPRLTTSWLTKTTSSGRFARPLPLPAMRAA